MARLVATFTGQCPEAELHDAPLEITVRLFLAKGANPEEVSSSYKSPCPACGNVVEMTLSGIAPEEQ